MGAGDADGYDGMLGLNGKDESTFLEVLNESIRTARTFRENENGVSLPDASCREIDALEGFMPIVPVDGDIATGLHGLTQDGKSEQFGFCQPAELNG